MTVRVRVSVIVFFLINCCGIDSAALNNTEVILVHVIFRHGERTTYEFYPNDPHKGETFSPIGFGGLTNNGKLMMFRLGQILRAGYGDLLGKDYDDNKLYVRSTDTLRTRMSALLVLAGLWPPNARQKWHPTLMWQPIPVFAKPFEEEDLLTPDSCKAYKKIVANVHTNFTIHDNYIEPQRDLFKYIEYNSGLVIKDFLDLVQIYFILKCEDEYGLKLPEWTKSIYPEPLHTAASMVYAYASIDANARKIHTGYLLQKILNDSLAKIDGTLLPFERRMFLYSGHESTVGNLLQALKVFEQKLPPYGSAVIIELHKWKGNYYLKLKYAKHPLHPSMEDLTIPNCDILCPINRFVQLQMDSENIPTVPYNQACDELK